MKNKIYLLFSFLVISSVINAQSFKKLYKESFKFLETNDYKSALPLLLEMHDLQPKNANTNFSIGNCLLNDQFRKTEAIPYYEKAMEGLTIGYRIGNHREKKAPLDVIAQLGIAYHQNYEFEKAVDKFEFYSNFLAENNWDDKRYINRQIRMAKYAKSLKDNPVDIDIVPVNEVNSSSAEYRPKLNAEETVMYFTSRRAVGSNSKKDDNGEYYEDIYISEKHHDVWTDPVLVNDVINTQENSSCLYLSPDAQKMYLYMYNTDKTKGPLGGKIFQSKLVGQKWTEPEYLDNTINSKYRETDASLDIYGNIAFFTSDREGGFGGRDIWMMKKLPNGEWAEAQNLGETINTEYDEEGAYLHPDGKTLYFSSKGHKVMGGFDFFKSELRVDGTWSIPENLGYSINTVGDDLFFFPSVNGKRAYFSSYRGDGLGNYDLYRINLVKESERDLAVYKGVVKDSSGNVVKDLIISIFDENRDDKYGIYRPNELTGRFLFILQPGHEYEIVYELNNISTSDSIVVPSDPVGIVEYTKVVTVGSEEITLSAGVVVDGDIVSIAMLEESNDIPILSLNNNESTNEEIVDNSSETIKNPIETKPDPVVFEPPTGETHINFYDNIYFKFESAELSNNVTSQLDKLLSYLNNNPKVQINAIGHTDSKGADIYNKKLSIIRANAVKTYLTNRGVDFHRIHAFGEGEDNPVAENYNPDGSDNPVGREANRRVEIQIIE
ncbi:MAG: hypothetical protein CL846_06395 [Crocinitomicaceae bacterium]|nr:hypothetical protein [Crocinitomicaceae bacterium]